MKNTTANIPSVLEKARLLKCIIFKHSDCHPGLPQSNTGGTDYYPFLTPVMNSGMCVGSVHQPVNHNCQLLR